MAKESVQFSLGLDGGPFVAGLRGALGQVTGGIGAQIKSGLGDIVKAFTFSQGVSAIKGIVDFAGKIRDSADALNVSTDFLQGFNATAVQSGATLGGVSKSLEILSRKMAEARAGEKQSVETFERYGIALKNADGSLRSVEEVVFDVSRKMNEATDSTERVRMAVDLLGKSGAQLIPTLSQGAEALGKMVNEAKKLSEADIDRLDALGDALTQLQTGARVVGGEAVTGIAKLAQYLGALSGQTDGGFFSVAGARAARDVLEGFDKDRKAQRKAAEDAEKEQQREEAWLARRSAKFAEVAASEAERLKVMEKAAVLESLMNTQREDLRKRLLADEATSGVRFENRQTRFYDERARSWDRVGRNDVADVWRGKAEAIRDALDRVKRIEQILSVDGIKVRNSK